MTLYLKFRGLSRANHICPKLQNYAPYAIPGHPRPGFQAELSFCPQSYFKITSNPTTLFLFASFDPQPGYLHCHFFLEPKAKLQNIVRCFITQFHVLFTVLIIQFSFVFLSPIICWNYSENKLMFISH